MTTTARLEREADTLFSKWVRGTGRCLHCGGTQGLQAAHIIRRDYSRLIRWNRLNAVCLCLFCAEAFTGHLNDWKAWITRMWPDRFDLLYSIADEQLPNVIGRVRDDDIRAVIRELRRKVA